MSVLFPWAFAFAILLPLLVLLYLLKTRRQPQTVSTLLFWHRVVRESKPRAVWRKLRHPFSLLLQLLILALLIFALARPVTEHAAPGLTVVLLDNRARMLAPGPDGRPAGEEALRKAVEYGPGAGHPDRGYILMEAAAQPRVLAGPTSDRRLWRQTLEEIEPRETGGSWPEAVRLAERLLAQSPGEKRLIAITGPGEPEHRPNDDLFYEWIPVGETLEQTALTTFGVRPSLVEPGGWELFLKAENFGSAPWESDLEIRLDDRLLEVRPLALAPGESRSLSLPLPRAAVTRDKKLEAMLTGQPTPTVGGRAHAVLSAFQPLRVLLLSEGNRFLEHVLRANPHLDFQHLRPDRFNAGMEAGFDAVIVDQELPPGLLESGQAPLLVFNTGPWLDVEASMERPWLEETDGPRHPALRRTRLEEVRLLEGSPVRDEFGGEILMTSAGLPMLVAGRLEPTNGDASQRLLVAGFDPVRSDLPMRVAFPLFIEDALIWLAGREEPVATGLRTGETKLLPPGARVGKTPGRDPEAWVENVFQPDRSGFYKVEGWDEAEWLAVSFLDREEAMALAREPGPQAEPGTVGQRAAIPIWIWLAFAAWALLLGEWWTYHRRVTE